MESGSTSNCAFLCPLVLYNQDKYVPFSLDSNSKSSTLGIRVLDHALNSRFCAPRFGAHILYSFVFYILY